MRQTDDEPRRAVTQLHEHLWLAALRRSKKRAPVRHAVLEGHGTLQRVDNTAFPFAPTGCVEQMSAAYQRQRVADETVYAVEKGVLPAVQILSPIVTAVFFRPLQFGRELTGRLAKQIGPAFVMGAFIKKRSGQQCAG